MSKEEEESRKQAWIQFACAWNPKVVQSPTNTAFDASMYADIMLKELETRFPPEENETKKKDNRKIL